MTAFINFFSRVFRFPILWRCHVFKMKDLPKWMTLIAMVSMGGCISDGGTYIPPGITGTLYLPDGAPAVNAVVALYPANYVPTASSSKAIVTQTNSLGQFSFSQVANGQYNL